MKFQRHLEENMTPEWQKAYIDYRGLKKRVTAIRRAQVLSSSSSEVPLNHPEDDHTASGVHIADPVPAPPPVAALPQSRRRDVPPDSIHSTHTYSESPSTHDLTSTDAVKVYGSAGSENVAEVDEERIPEIPKSTSVHTETLPRLRRRTTALSTMISSIRYSGHSTGQGPIASSSRSQLSARLGGFKDWDRKAVIPLRDLFPMLTPVQRAFFEKLDEELERVENFYCDREKEMRQRVIELKQQLQELTDHRRAFYAAHPIVAAHQNWLPVTLPITRLLLRSSKFREDADGIHFCRSSKPRASVRQSTGVDIGAASNENTEETDDAAERTEEEYPPSPVDGKHDPDEYQNAKKRLRKAVLECYRGLELLNNYRRLNLIGFQKALKKFEKVTGIPAQKAYTIEKIEPSAFSSETNISSLLQDMEVLFAARFTRGDRKKAMMLLRGGHSSKTHHFSTFRSGLMLGLAVPAFVDGVYQSFQQDTRRSIPAWDGLLFVYGLLLVPTLFSVLVGVNLVAWSIARINYVFIFELDSRTRIDYREYFELPSFLLSTLCYAFWLSFARIGSHHVMPTTWPLLWLLLLALVMLNPLPVFFKSSRWWLLKNIARLLTSGAHRVEFADFWMGDQFCSLIFTLSNLYFIGCAYADGLDTSWRRCTTGPRNWAIGFVLASLPLFVRLVQSVKRWVDSGLITHLINGGKYGSGIIYYLCYYLWRENGGVHGSFFVAWCIFGTIYALYASTWDFLMDWSVLRPRAKHPLLRSEILYTNRIPLYYVAIITNICIRFIWVLYIPRRGPNFVLRTFIAGLLEVFRRWQWNFFRLENEHLGNMDQYRVTREVPLPYTFSNSTHDSEGGDEEDEPRRMSISSKSIRRKRGDQRSEEQASDVAIIRPV